MSLAIELDLGCQLTGKVALKGFGIDGPQVVASIEQHGITGLAPGIVGGHRRITSCTMVDGIEAKGVLTIDVAHRQQID